MFNNPFYLYITMNNQEKKAGDPSGSFQLLNQLIITLEEAELKLEDAYKRNNPVQMNAIKQFMLKIQRQIAEEIK
jgi:hypothetical protein